MGRNMQPLDESRSWGRDWEEVGEQKLFTFARYLQDLPPLDAFMETLLREVG